MSLHCYTNVGNLWHAENVINKIEQELSACQPRNDSLSTQKEYWLNSVWKGFHSLDKEDENYATYCSTTLRKWVVIGYSLHKLRLIWHQKYGTHFGLPSNYDYTIKCTLQTINHNDNDSISSQSNDLIKL